MGLNLPSAWKSGVWDNRGLDFVEQVLFRRDRALEIFSDVKNRLLDLEEMLSFEITLFIFFSAIN